MKVFHFIIFCYILASCKASSKSNLVNNIEFEREAIIIDSTKIQFPWLSNYDVKNNVQNNIPLPKGYYRENATANSFTHWLRHLPLKPNDMIVNLYNGDEKAIQSAQFAILDIDVGKEDLQQCADAVMRLRIFVCTKTLRPNTFPLYCRRFGELGSMAYGYATNGQWQQGELATNKHRR